MITTYATIWKVCGSRDPLRRTVVLSTSELQEEGERGVTTIKFVMMTMTMLWPKIKFVMVTMTMLWPRTSFSWWPCCDRRSSVNLNHQVVKNEIMNYCAQELLVVTQDHLNHGHQVVKIFLCSGASGLFHSKQHHWWGVQRSWPLSMGLLWPRNPIPGAWPIVGIRVWPFLRLGVGGQIQKIWNIEKWINIKKNRCWRAPPSSWFSSSPPSCWPSSRTGWRRGCQGLFIWQDKIVVFIIVC